MAPTTHHRQRTVAATLAVASAGLLAFGAFCGGQHLRAVALTSTESVLEAAFTALATACLTRLSWVCVAASRDVLAAEGIETSPGLPESASPSPAMARARSGRARAASLFLALAALLATGAGAATAAPVTVTVSASAPSPDFGVSVDASSLLPAPRASTTTPPSPDAAIGSDASCPTPTPGWTPSASGVDSDACRLLMPGERTERTAEHVVLRGQTLWSIAAAHLPHDAPAEDVADAMRAWINANPGLRENPDLIHPGDVLTAPTSVTAATR